MTIITRSFSLFLLMLTVANSQESARDQSYLLSPATDVTGVPYPRCGYKLRDVCSAILSRLLCCIVPEEPDDGEQYFSFVQGQARN